MRACRIQVIKEGMIDEETTKDTKKILRKTAPIGTQAQKKELWELLVTYQKHIALVYDKYAAEPQV